MICITHFKSEIRVEAFVMEKDGVVPSLAG